MGFTVSLTHDVDRVYKTFQYVTHDLRHLKLKRMRTLFTGERPYWTFEQLMDIEDRYGVRSTFFFLEESIKPELASPRTWALSYGRYKFRDPRVARVIRELDAGGWEIGLHGSYNSFRDGGLLKREKAALEEVLGKPVTGIRQHYLNLDVPQTWQHQYAAGLRYDTSFGKRNDIGFREDRYRPFVDAASGMTVIPLALMEGYLFDMAEGNEERAWSLALQVIDAAEANDAVFTVLWHPHLFYAEEFPGVGALYERLIRECQARGARFLTCREIYQEMPVARTN